MVHWFKRHPQYLAAESEALSSDGNYKQLFQVRENLFVSHGTILVRLNTTHRFPILIVYPEATPYVLPLVYPLQRNLSEEEVQAVAKGSSAEVLSKIQDQLHIFYQFRHQNESGNLCILEWDDLDEGPQFYSITAVLKRVRDWFKGTITGEFPLDSAEVDFHAHFWKKAHDLSLLYPEKFLDIKLIEGEAYCLLFSKMSKGKFYANELITYFGCAIAGTSQSGFYETLDSEMPNFFVEEGIRNAVELITKKDLLKRYTESGKVIKFAWFQLPNEPAPFRTLEELVKLIGEGDFERGTKRMQRFFEDEQKEKPPIILIAIRFPNRKGLQEFQLFRILKKQELLGALIGVSGDEAFQHFLNSYELVEAVQCEKFAEDTYHARNTGRAERSILKEKAVNVVGVGALGSEIADSLAKAGMGTLCLFDNQVIKAPNPVRHLAGLDHYGIGKVYSVAQIISDHNPYVTVWPIPGDINGIDLNEFFMDDAIAISSLAEDNTEGYLNERAIIANKIVYYARALRGAKAARIFRVIPGKDACFHCLKLYRLDGGKNIYVPDDKNLPILRNECNSPIRPASAADLKLIAALTSRIILDELQNGFGENNHWIWSSEAIEDFTAMQVHSQFVAPHPKCYYCNHEKKATVILSENVLKKMQVIIAENPAIETGGVLAGYQDETGNFVISHASGPGPNAIRSATKFQKDFAYCQAFLDDLFVQSGKKIVYVGEWHSHPSKINKPSSTDLKSLNDIAFQKEYLTDMPVMIIFSNAGEPSCTVHPAGKTFYFAELHLSKT